MPWLDFPAWFQKNKTSAISIQKIQCFPHKWVTNTQLYLPQTWLAPLGSLFGFSRIFFGIFLVSWISGLNLGGFDLEVDGHWITKKSAPVQNAANKISYNKSTWNILKHSISFILFSSNQQNISNPEVWFQPWPTFIVCLMIRVTTHWGPQKRSPSKSLIRNVSQPNSGPRYIPNTHNIYGCFRKWWYPKMDGL